MTTSSTRDYGYIRVSTVQQTLDRQMDSIRAHGIDPEHIYSDKISGTRQSRPGLDELLRHVRPGDSIWVPSLDRLGRSALHVMQTIADLDKRQIIVRSLKTGEDLTGATGKMMAGIIILIAEWERNMNSERVAEARAARASRAGDGEQVAGRPRTAMVPAKISAVKALRAAGKSISAIAENQGISRASVYRALAA